MSKSFHHCLALAALLAVLLAGCARPDVNQLMGQAYTAAKSGDLGEAEALSEQCLRINAAHTQARLLNAYCRFCRQSRDGDRRQALYDLGKCTILEPENLDAWLLYGWALVQSGQSREAIAPLRRAQSLLPVKGGPRPQVQLLLGRCYVENNLQPQALSILQPLQLREPYRDWPELYNSLALLALRRNQPLQAVRFLNEGLRHSPSHEVLLQNLAVIYDTHLDNPALARQYYRDCMKRAQDRGDDAAVQRLMRRLVQVGRRIRK